MKKLIFVAVLLSGCHEVVRDEATYRAEVGFMQAAAMQEAESLVALVKAHCKCEGGKFTTSDCERAAKRALVVQSRVPWHTAMMLYNARLTENRPDPKPPEVPPTSSLCAQ